MPALAEARRLACWRRAVTLPAVRGADVSDRSTASNRLGLALRIGALVGMCVLPIIAFSGRHETSSVPVASGALPSPKDGGLMSRDCAPRVVAELPDEGAVSLVGTTEGIFGITPRERFFRVGAETDGAQATVSVLGPSGPHPTGSFFVRRGRLAWVASHELLGSDSDGRGRSLLASDAFAAALGPADLYVLRASGELVAMHWPESNATRHVASVRKQAERMVVSYPWIFGASASDVWALNLETHALRDVPQCPGDICQRIPRDLGAVANLPLVTWHEGPPMPFMGRDSRAFLFDVAAWKLTQLPPADNDPGFGADFVADGRCVYTGNAARGLAQPRWSYVDGNRMVGEDGPVADDGAEWLWIERERDGGRSRLWAAQKVPCCDRALASVQP